MAVPAAVVAVPAAVVAVPAAAVAVPAAVVAVPAAVVAVPAAVVAVPAAAAAVMLTAGAGHRCPPVSVRCYFCAKVEPSGRRAVGAESASSHRSRAVGNAAAPAPSGRNTNPDTGFG